MRCKVVRGFRRSAGRVTLGLLLACGACIQPEEQVGADFGTYKGNAVTDTGRESDAGSDEVDDVGTDGSQGGDGTSSADGTGSSPSDGSGEDPGTGGATDGDGTGTDGTDPGTDGPSGVDAGTVDPGNGDGTPPPPPATTFTFSVLTRELGGNEAPANIGAIWIMTASNQFVKTLERWAERRLQYLTFYADQTGRNTVDAVTSATLERHETHTVRWDLTDVDGNRVPDGDYQVLIETTDHNGTGDHLAIPFTLGAPFRSSPPNTSHYVNMSLALE